MVISTNASEQIKKFIKDMKKSLQILNEENVIF